MESDKVVTLNSEFVRPHLALVESVATEMAEGEGSITPAPDSPAKPDVEDVGRSFGASWYESASPETVDQLKRDSPRIPYEIDRALLAQGRAALGSNIQDDDRKQLRRGFWQAIDSLASTS